MMSRSGRAWCRAVMSIGSITRTNVQDLLIGHVTHDGPYSGSAVCLIAEDITVGHGAILHACTIGDRRLIGMGALVLDGAVIESDVMLLAGSLVSPGKARVWLSVPGSPGRNRETLERA